MKWTRLFILSIILMFCGCSKPNKQLNNEEITDKKSAPIEDIVVNKEYDEDGNIIRYDSTYSSFYSNIKGDKNAEDSILKNFKSLFEKKYPFSFNPSFNDFFYRDSLMKFDFYKKDFFINRFKQNEKWSEKLFQEMDSIKDKFFDEQFPEPEEK